MSSVLSTPARQALRIAVLYALFGALWIAVSDWAVEHVLSEAWSLTHGQTAKGFLFVAVTAFLVFVLVRSRLAEVSRVSLRLGQSEKQLRAIYDAVSDAILVHDAQTGAILDANVEACALTGRSREALLATDVGELSIGESGYTQVEALARIRRAAAGETLDFEWCSRRPDGTPLWVEVRLRPATISGNRVVIAATRDISARKQAEQALRESEERFRTLVELLPYGVEETDAAGRILFANPALERLQAAAPGALQGRTIASLLATEAERAELARYMEELATQQPEPTPYFARNLRDDGRPIEVQVNWTYRRDAVGRLSGFVAVVSDITERRQAESRLRASEAMLNQAERVARLGSWRFHPELGTLQWSDQVFRLFGYEPGAFEPDWARFMSMVVPEDWARLEAVREAAAQGQPPVGIDYAVALPDGRRRVLHTEYTALRDDSGPDGWFIGTVQDVTEQRQVEEERARLSAERDTLLERLQLQFRAMPVGCLIATPDLTILEWNPAAERIFGFARAEVIGRAPYGLIVPQRMRPELDGFVAALIAGDQTRQAVHENLTRDGRTILCEWHDTPLRDAAGRVVGLVGMVQDITERKRAEEQLETYARQLQQLSRRLFAVQEEERRALARELHDEVGQQLAALKLNLSVLGKTGLDPSLRALLDDCLELAETTIAQIRDRAMDLRPSVLDDLGLAAALDWYLRRQAARSGCSIVLHAAGVPGGLPGETATAAFRIVQEAVNNALRHGQARRIDVALDTVHNDIVIEVVDDGSGFDVAAALQRARQGYGIGLTGMRERTELGGGSLEISSAAGRGTRILARLALSNMEE